MKENEIYPCPSCGFLVFEEPPGSYAICDICGWEDDHVQLATPGLKGGANSGSLKDYQDRILKEYPPDIREADGFQRDSNWRPLTDAECVVSRPEDGTGVDYFHAACKVEPAYYWKTET